MINFAYVLVVAVAVAAGSVDATRSVRREDKCNSIVEVASATPELSDVVSLVSHIELGMVLENAADKYTVFAPVNSAFDHLDLGDDAVAELLKDPTGTAMILADHVVLTSAYKAADLKDGQELLTAGGSTLTVSVARDGTVTIIAPNDGSVATVLKADIMACGSVIHLIDQVLVASLEVPDDEFVPTAAPLDVAIAPAMAPLSFDVETSSGPVPVVTDDIFGSYGDDLNLGYGGVAPIGTYGAPIGTYGAPIGTYGAPIGTYGGDAMLPMMDAAVPPTGFVVMPTDDGLEDMEDGFDVESPLATGDARAASATSLEQDTNTSSATVIIVGAVVAAVVAGLAGLAGFIYHRRRNALASAGLPDSTHLYNNSL